MVGEHATVDVRHRDGRVERDVPAERLTAVHPFAPGQFVVGGGWVGRIDSIRHDVSSPCSLQPRRRTASAWEC